MKVTILLTLVLGAAVGAQTTGPHVPWRAIYEARGELLRVEGANLIIRREEPGQAPAEFTIDASGVKSLIVDEEVGQLEDLKPGMALTVTGYSSKDKASRPERVRASSPSLNASVVRVDGKKIVVQPTTRQAQQTSVITDDQTRIVLTEILPPDGRVLQRELKVGELESGMRVRIIPPKGTARKILVGRKAVPATQP